MDDKRKKYKDNIEGLRSDGWEPALHTLVLGTLGEIPSKTISVLEELGVRGPVLDRLIEDIIALLCTVASATHAHTHPHIHSLVPAHAQTPPHIHAPVPAHVPTPPHLRAAPCARTCAHPPSKTRQ
eukprot:1193624-Prorocentrum_minimum.AAC.1